VRSALRAEGYKLWRRGTLLGVVGSLLVLTVALTIVVFARASGAPPGPGGSLSDLAPPLRALATSDGLSHGFLVTSNFATLIALVFYAQSVGGEYREGTLKVLLSREPRRLHLLAGKLGALSVFFALALAASLVVEVGASVVGAAARGVDTSAWWTSDALGAALGLYARVLVATLVHGLAGACLAIVFRSAVASVGIGFGFLFVGEEVVISAWHDAASWLPHATLHAFVKGGTPDVGLAEGAWVAAAYAAVLLVASGWIWRARDVRS
jgi:hypothetical protein